MSGSEVGGGGWGRATPSVGRVATDRIDYLPGKAACSLVSSLYRELYQNGFWQGNVLLENPSFDLHTHLTLKVLQQLFYI